VLNSPEWPVKVNSDQRWFRIPSMNELDNIKKELRNLGQVYQIVAYMVLLDKIGQIRCKWHIMVQNMFQCRDMIYLPYLCLHYKFWQISTLSARFDHIATKMSSKCKLARNGPQWYNMSRCTEVWPFIATFDAAQLIVVNFEELNLIGYVCLSTPKSGRHCIIRHLMVQYGLI